MLSTSDEYRHIKMRSLVLNLYSQDTVVCLHNSRYLPVRYTFFAWLINAYNQLFQIKLLFLPRSTVITQGVISYIFQHRWPWQLTSCSWELRKIY